MTEKEKLDRIQKVFPDKEEALNILEYDKKVEKGLPTEYDLPPDKQKVAQSFCRTGTRQTKKKAPTVYKFEQPKQRKADIPKETIIKAVNDCLLKTVNAENVNITNPTREIKFSIGTDNYTITLIRNTKKK